MRLTTTGIDVTPLPLPPCLLPTLPPSLPLHHTQTHLQLEHCVLGVVAYGLNGSARHEVEQAQDEVRALAQDLIRLTAVQPELTVVLAVL